MVADQKSLRQSLREAGVASGNSYGLSVAGFDRDSVDVSLAANLQNLLSHTNKLADAGASIVAWAESSAVLFKSSEAQFDATASEVAMRNSIYLVAAVNIVADPVDEKQEPVENKLVIFGPNGDKLGQYIKAKALWNENIVEGNGKPLVIDTPHLSLIHI